MKVSFLFYMSFSFKYTNLEKIEGTVFLRRIFFCFFDLFWLILSAFLFYCDYKISKLAKCTLAGTWNIIGIIYKSLFFGKKGLCACWVNFNDNTAVVGISCNSRVHYGCLKSVLSRSWLIVISWYLRSNCSWKERRATMNYFCFWDLPIIGARPNL